MLAIDPKTGFAVLEQEWRTESERLPYRLQPSDDVRDMPDDSMLLKRVIQDLQFENDLLKGAVKVLRDSVPKTASAETGTLETGTAETGPSVSKANTAETDASGADATPACG